jgi:membrane-bound lytic murein transglycosylase A
MLSKRFSLLASSIVITALVSACSTTPPKSVETAPAPSQAPPTSPVPVAGPVLRPVAFNVVPGWDRDDVREAWPAFLTSCEVMVKRAAWKEPCTVARTVDANNAGAIRKFFEAFFVPHQVFNPDGTDNGLITGYYEPLLNGARKRGGPYQTPLHRAPDDLLTIDLGSVYPELKNMRLRGKVVGNKVVPYPARAELTQSAAMSGNELVWVDNPIDAFFLQVQGSGRVQFADTKEVVRVAYADQNGHPYRSIGRYLVDKGELTMDQASAQGIKAWLAANPKRQQELLNANPGYVFFKEEKLTDPRKGPKGALGVPLTPQRSVAVDPNFIPLGAPVFLSTTHPGSNAPLQRMMVAQDTGGAIKNAVRADYFWGFGAEAGEKAGKMKQRGMLWVLLPKPGTA